MNRPALAEQVEGAVAIKTVADHYKVDTAQVRDAIKDATCGGELEDGAWTVQKIGDGGCIHLVGPIGEVTKRISLYFRTESKKISHDTQQAAGRVIGICSWTDGPSLPRRQATG